jgi:bifunctional DNA-binding transcriptional regulator/antitoxin component of YhaV-PrlF toxin-antitoxin module
MLKAIVEEDGRIRLPDEIREAAHFEVGQELDFIVLDGAVTLLAPCSTYEEVEYSEKFLKSLADAKAERAAGGSTFHECDEAFLAALTARTKAE